MAVGQVYNREHQPWPMAQLLGVLSCAPKGCEFNSWSGHTPRLRVWSLAKAGKRDNRLIFLSHINISLSLSLPLSPPSSFSKISECILGWGLKKKKMTKQESVAVVWAETLGAGPGAVVWETWEATAQGIYWTQGLGMDWNFRSRAKGPKNDSQIFGLTDWEDGAAIFFRW